MPSATDRRSSAIGRFFRSSTTGEVVVVQAPNIPLWVFLVATAIRLVLRPHGSVGTALSVVGSVSLVGWALWEIARGDSPFRRALGGVVLLVVVVGFVSRA
jgi:hypothetical protein